MRTLLLFPPQAHFTQPYLALPSLVAYLRANGFPDTHQLDLNLDSLEHFLAPGRLARSRARVAERLAAFDARAARGEALDLGAMDEFKALAEADLAGDAVVAGIDDALATLRDAERFFDYGQYLAAVKRLDRAFKLISAEWYPTVLSPNSFAMKWSIEREADVLAAIGDEETNLYLEYYRERALPKIVEAAPDLVGISITYGSMVIPALTLARLIKEALPRVHVTVGGGLLAYAGEKIAKSGKVFDVIDSLVLLEGEGPLLAIARALADGTPFDEVPNVLWRKDGQVRKNRVAAPLDIDSLPTPEFDGLPLPRYFSPHVALPLAITRGCYYEKCVFCTLYKVIGPGYRQRRLDKILDDLETVTKKHDSPYVYFVVEDMPPVLFRKLPEALASRGLDIRWWTDARLEKDLYTPELCRRLHESGCRRIAFGFESASQRVLDLMDKGTCIDEAGTIVQNVAEAGIAVVLYTMIGFPTETEEEARATLGWIREHRPWIQEVSLRIFYIDNLSTVFAQPERFRITRLLTDQTKDYQVYVDHECEVGMDRVAARRIFFDFMEVVRAEFPLFQGDNLWLFELKSHHFFYLCREGSLDVFRGRSSAHVPQEPPASLRDAAPRPAPRVTTRVLPYDLAKVTQTLLAAEDETLRPRYQSGSFKAEMIEQVGARVAPLPPAPTAFAFRGGTSDFLRLGRDGLAILAALDGTLSVGALLGRYPEAARPKVLDFVRGLWRKGLIEARAAREPRREREMEATA